MMSKSGKKKPRKKKPVFDDYQLGIGSAVNARRALGGAPEAEDRAAKIIIGVGKLALKASILGPIASVVDPNVEDIVKTAYYASKFKKAAKAVAVNDKKKAAVTAVTTATTIALVSAVSTFGENASESDEDVEVEIAGSGDEMSAELGSDLLEFTF